MTAKQNVRVEALDAHPFEVLRRIGELAEARTAQSILKTLAIRRALKGDEVGSDEFDTNLVAAASYAGHMRYAAIKKFEREVYSVSVGFKGMQQHIEGAAEGSSSVDREKEVKIALTNALFHSSRVTVEFFWEFSTALIGQEKTPETMSAALGQALDLQMEVFAKLHEGFALIAPEALPDWPATKEKMTKERDELLALASASDVQCGCPDCTAERELEAQEAGQPKKGQATPVAQTIH